MQSIQELKRYIQLYSIDQTDESVLKVALKEDGTVVAWGMNIEGQCNIPKGLTS